jgi:hypothetical protein
MEKLCSNCKEIKDETFFYKNKNNKKDGLQGTCKRCSYLKTKESIKKKRLLDGEPKRKQDGKFLTLSGIKQEDYCTMYDFLSKIGFNVSGDIHLQFCEKWGLKVSKSPRKGVENKWTYKDCQE